MNITGNKAQLSDKSEQQYISKNNNISKSPFQPQYKLANQTQNFQQQQQQQQVNQQQQFQQFSNFQSNLLSDNPQFQNQLDQKYIANQLYKTAIKEIYNDESNNYQTLNNNTNTNNNLQMVIDEFNTSSQNNKDPLIYQYQNKQKGPQGKKQLKQKPLNNKNIVIFHQKVQKQYQNQRIKDFFMKQIQEGEEQEEQNTYDNIQKQQQFQQQAQDIQQYQQNFVLKNYNNNVNNNVQSSDSLENEAQQTVNINNLVNNNQNFFIPGTKITQPIAMNNQQSLIGKSVQFPKIKQKPKKLLNKNYQIQQNQQQVQQNQPLTFQQQQLQEKQQRQSALYQQIKENQFQQQNIGQAVFQENVNFLGQGVGIQGNKINVKGNNNMTNSPKSYQQQFGDFQNQVIQQQQQQKIQEQNTNNSLKNTQQQIEDVYQPQPVQLRKSFTYNKKMNSSNAKQLSSNTKNKDNSPPHNRKQQIMSIYTTNGTALKNQKEQRYSQNINSNIQQQAALQNQNQINSQQDLIQQIDILLKNSKKMIKGSDNIFNSQQYFSKDEQRKLFNYFRYHSLTIAQVLGRKELYLEGLTLQQSNKDKIIIKTHLSQITKKQLQQMFQHNQVQQQQLAQKLIKFASTKGKYKYRERFNFLTSQQLKSLNYDARKRIDSYKEWKQQKKKQKQQQYSSSDDEEESDDDSPKYTKKQKNQQNEITDLNAWKRKNGVDSKTKVYIVKGGYRSLKASLEDRGWVENPEPFSQCFDYKWTCKIIDINFDQLKDFQVVNHFDQSQCLASKYGITRSLRTSVYNNDIDIDTYYPKCYDLGDLQGFEDFIENFKLSKYEKILKDYYKILKFIGSNCEDEFVSDFLTNEKQIKIKLACDINLRRCRSFNEIFVQINSDILPILSPQEWDICLQEDKNNSQIKKQMLLQENQISTQGSSSNNKENENNEQESDQNNNTQQNININQDNQEQKSSQKINTPNKNNNSKSVDIQQKNKDIIDKLIQQIEAVFKKLEQSDPQFHMNGDKNIWIAKPNYLSRARGIKLFTNLDKILDTVVIQEKMQYVVQKYIENPLIIKRKKFDIRQWVVIQDYNPPKIWFYEECYVRFCSHDYDDSELFNKNSHLTNNCLNQKVKDKNSEIKENMWTQQNLVDYLQEQNQGKDVFFEIIQPQIKKIIINSIKCCTDQISGRKNSMELFGYDFMIDERLNPWLIEVNSSPTMEHSTSITANLVERVLEDVLKVTVDYQYAKKQQKKNIDTGGFSLIYKGTDTVKKSKK